MTKRNRIHAAIADDVEIQGPSRSTKGRRDDRIDETIEEAVQEWLWERDTFGPDERIMHSMKGTLIA